MWKSSWLVFSEFSTSHWMERSLVICACAHERHGFLHIIYIYASVLLCLTSFILSFENSNTSSAYAYISEMNALSSIYHWECTAHTGGLHGELSVIVPSLLDHFSSPTYCRAWEGFACPAFTDSLQLGLQLCIQMAQTHLPVPLRIILWNPISISKTIPC